MNFTRLRKVPGQALAGLVLGLVVLALRAMLTPTPPLPQPSPDLECIHWSGKVPPTAKPPAVQGMDRVIPLFEVRDATASGALEQWRALAGVDLAFYWDKYDPHSKVSLRVENKRASEVLDRLLATIDPELLAISENGALCISRYCDELRMYDVRDLVLADAEPGTTQPASAHAAAPRWQFDPDAVGRLADKIIKSIDTDSWVNNGGSTGFILPVAGRMVIIQRPEAHRRIEMLLAEWRKQRKSDPSSRKAADRP